MPGPDETPDAHNEPEQGPQEPSGVSGANADEDVDPKQPGPDVPTYGPSATAFLDAYDVGLGHATRLGYEKPAAARAFATGYALGLSSSDAAANRSG